MAWPVLMYREIRKTKASVMFQSTTVWEIGIKYYPPLLLPEESLADTPMTTAMLLLRYNAKNNLP